jgi:hypothetical protein
MSTPESYRNFSDTHNEVSRNFATRAEEEQISFYTGLQDLNAKAGDELRKIHENYLQELQAAQAGDDSMQRAATAYRNLQREYSRIQAEYSKKSELHHQQMFETMNSLCVSSSVKVLDSWIEYLRDMRQNLAAREEQKASTPKPNEPKQNEPKSGKKPTS